MKVYILFKVYKVNFMQNNCFFWKFFYLFVHYFPNVTTVSTEPALCFSAKVIEDAWLAAFPLLPKVAVFASDTISADDAQHDCPIKPPITPPDTPAATDPEIKIAQTSIYCNLHHMFLK